MAHDNSVGGGKQVEHIGQKGENFEGRDSGSGAVGGVLMTGRQQRGGFGVWRGFLREGHVSGGADVLVATGVVSLVVGSGTAPLFDGDPDGIWQSERGKPDRATIDKETGKAAAS